MLGYLRKRDVGWFGRNDYQILLVLEGETPIAGVIGDYLEAPDVAVVEFLVVSSERRGRGLGRTLLAAFEDAMKASARKTGRPLFAVVAEMNDPYRWTPHADSLDPFTRAAIWHSWGFGRVDFPYVQAALSAGQSPVTTLMLIAKLSGETIDPRTVKLIVHEYMRWAMRIDEPGRNAEFLGMARFLDRKAEGRQAIAVEPLGEYLAEAGSLPFEVHEAGRGDAELLRQIAGVYGRCFLPGATSLQPAAFGEALESGRHEGEELSLSSVGPLRSPDRTDSRDGLVLQLPSRGLRRVRVPGASAGRARPPEATGELHRAADDPRRPRSAGMADRVRPAGEEHHRQVRGGRAFTGSPRCTINHRCSTLRARGAKGRRSRFSSRAWERASVSGHGWRSTSSSRRWWRS